MIITKFYINKCSVQYELIHTNISFFMDWWYSSDQDGGGGKHLFYGAYSLVGEI